MKEYFRILKEEDFITSAWSGGTTTQLFVYPENSSYAKGNFKVRISSATVELEQSTFTKLAGVSRFITPLNGGLTITHDVENFKNLVPFEIYKFDGGLPTTSYGKVNDFNLMLANGANGELCSFHILENEVFEIPINKEVLNILYSYDGFCRIHIDKDELKLSPNEMIVIKSNSVKRIRIHSTKSIHILQTLIFE